MRGNDHPWTITRETVQDAQDGTDINRIIKCHCDSGKGIDKNIFFTKYLLYNI